jgi:hypothetical protein
MEKLSQKSVFQSEFGIQLIHMAKEEGPKPVTHQVLDLSLALCSSYKVLKTYTDSKPSLN